MKTLNYFLSLLLTSSIIISCVSENPIMPLLSSNSDSEKMMTRSSGSDLDIPYITRPDLEYPSDTTNYWVFKINVDRRVNGEYIYGKRGNYTQLQYTTSQYPNESDWRDVMTKALNPLYVDKEYYPFGVVYFRARTMVDEKLAKIENSRQWLYSSELSPWSPTLYTKNNIYKKGISLTKKNVVVNINFIFNAKYTGDLRLSDFKALIMHGNTSSSYTVQDKYGKKSGYRETYTFTIDKDEFSGFSDCSNTLTISNNSFSSYVSFNPQIFILKCKRDEITQPYSFNVYVEML